MRTLSVGMSRVASPAPDWRFAVSKEGRLLSPNRVKRFAVFPKLFAVFLPRGRNSALPLPQFSQVSAGCDGGLHVLHGNPFQRAMRVVFTAKQVWGRKT